MLVADIMAAVRDLVTVSKDDQLKRHIASAARDYSRYQGVLATTVATTVADQTEYTISGCTGIDDVIWYPGGDVVYANELITPVRTFPVSAPDDNANRLIDAITQAADEASARGGWDFVNGKLWLYPTPTLAGLTVTVYYRTAHVISGSGTTLAYATIPAWHFDAIVWLTAASVLQAQAAGRANQFDYTEGLTKVARGNMTDNLVKVAQDYRSRALTMIS